MTHYTKEEGTIFFACGGTANFTDVHVTSAGLMQAITECRNESIHQKV